MVTLTRDMKDLFARIKLFPVATASKKGVPHVTPIAFVSLVRDDTIWLADNYMSKTLANIRENPFLALYLYDADSKKCCQIHGRVEVKTTGTDYEAMKKMVLDKKPGLPAKSLLVMTITDVYDCMPGPGAGKKVL
ncbi:MULTISPECIES: pyridoxamine 5'-phosphate oxidase family protein [unclassified Methanoregula]|uniref:pyridoxamine 5'-phosphate oxidase family protein n=1 Tax=unclassified Methanoregula TaxID=2649730 RepID=UPI0025CE5429|nr:MULTISPECIES: pyridoxamine 5'-phosphate oxidase family protein [unclassified Methanoregula]